MDITAVTIQPMRSQLVCYWLPTIEKIGETLGYVSLLPVTPKWTTNDTHGSAPENVVGLVTVVESSMGDY